PLVEESATTLAADFPVRAVGLRADVTDATDVDAAFARATDALGTPTVLVNNLTGTFFCCQALARGCLSTGRPGAIVNVSSMSAQVVNLPQHQASYHASKAGVDMLTKALAVEWASAGIRVNAIAPGYMLSDMTRRFTEENPDLARQWTGMIPVGRMGEPADLEALLIFLCSERSSYLVGQSVVIDGAYTAI